MEHFCRSAEPAELDFPRNLSLLIKKWKKGLIGKPSYSNCGFDQILERDRGLKNARKKQGFLPLLPS